MHGNGFLRSVALALRTLPVTMSASIPPIILPEILGFSPHLLLDDIVDIANDAIRLTVNAMEGFILRWAQERAKNAPKDWDGKAESEMGVISLQTLLESHTDLAFDALEAWSLRNIFTLDPELPIVLPHHRHLNLHEPDGADTALMHRIEELRRQLANVRCLSTTPPRLPPLTLLPLFLRNVA
jgi:kinetochore protein Mis12/MTW1